MFAWLLKVVVWIVSELLLLVPLGSSHISKSQHMQCGDQEHGREVAKI